MYDASSLCAASAGSPDPKAEGEQMGRVALWGSVAVFVCITASLVNAGIKPQAGLAYTDPGSGAMIIQLLTTFGLMAAFYFSRARHWVAKRLGLARGTQESDASALHPEDESGAGND
jgi:hypothetical protein